MMAALRSGETVLVTGATGYIGSQVASSLLTYGAKLKLVVRDEQKAAKVVNALKQVHGQDAPIITTVVKDFTVPGAFEEATQGVEGVAHIASDTSFDSDPKKVIPPVLAACNNLLTSLAKTPSIRRLVFTSSSNALGAPNLNGKDPQYYTENTWHNNVVDLIQTEPTPRRVYAASKVLAERTLWDTVKTIPHLTTNSILPNMTYGPALPGLTPSTSGQWLVEFARGDMDRFVYSGPQHGVDIRDVAELHSIALFNESVVGERILAFAQRYTLNEMVGLIKKVRPESPIEIRKGDWDVVDNTIPDVRRAIELLGRPFRPFEDTVHDTVQYC